MIDKFLLPAAMLLCMSFLSVLWCAEVTLPAAKARIREVGKTMADGAWNLWSNGGLGDWFEAERPGNITVTLVAAGQPAKDVFPIARLWAGSLEGGAVTRTFTVDSEEFKEYRFEIDAPKGVFLLRCDFTNDFVEGKEDRNLFLREIRVSGARLAPGAPDVRAATDEAIRKLRCGTLTVRTTPGATVKVTQLRHEFAFGTAISTRMFRDKVNPQDRKKYLETLKANFNAAVHENALKWYSTQRRKGKPTWQDAGKILVWCEQNDIAMRGHCIFWAADKYVQGWVKALDDETLRVTLRARALDVTRRFRGRIGEYDVNNEMVSNSYYARRLGQGIRVKMFRWAREGDPDAVLYVNDYAVLTPGNRHLDAYEKQIEWLIAQGAPVGGIGCQGHFGGPVDVLSVRRALDRLARFKLPLKITEFDVNLDDETAKAKSLEDFYRVCFAHPAVEGILMWGFWEGAHWRPKAALWKREWTPTPAAKTYRKLVFNEWWTTFEGKADEKGLCTLRAFFGTHHVEAGDKTVLVDLRKKNGALDVSVGR